MIPLMNVTRQYESIKNEIDEAVMAVLKSGQFILGEAERRFEAHMAEYLGVKYAVGVGNGTDALVIALRACGIKPGDEVITSAMSFFATAESIAAVGAKPVFIDCTNDTYVMDSSKVESAITDKTKAIIPVHLYGQCVDMDSLLNMAKKHSIKVIEDTAQACGAEQKGHKAGTMGDVGCISFFPTKNLGGAGDGGMIVTDDEGIYRQCKALRVHGSGLDGLFSYGAEQGIAMDESSVDFNGNLPKYYNFVLGYNSRLDTIQAAMLDVKLKYLNSWNARRREIAKRYDNQIINPLIMKPYIANGNIPIYYVYAVAADNRDGLRNYLKEHDIGSGVYFPVPLHEQKAFEGLGYKHGDFPNTEYIAEHTLVIPMFPELTDEEIGQVIEVINGWKG